MRGRPRSGAGRRSHARGVRLADVLDLIAVHETFEANHAKQQAVIDGMETYVCGVHVLGATGTVGH